MSNQLAMRSPTSDKAETIVPFARTATESIPNNADLLDSAGQTILGMLSRAAGMAEENSKHALDAAHKLSLQLQAAEDRIKDLEADVRHHQDRADRAEKWLYQISLEIEERFFGAANSHRVPAPRQRTNPQDYAPRR
jgi:hypothetical protein